MLEPNPAVHARPPALPTLARHAPLFGNLTHATRARTDESGRWQTGIRVGPRIFLGKSLAGAAGSRCQRVTERPILPRGHRTLGAPPGRALAAKLPPLGWPWSIPVRVSQAPQNENGGARMAAALVCVLTRIAGVSRGCPVTVHTPSTHKVHGSWLSGSAPDWHSEAAGQAAAGWDLVRAYMMF